MTISALPGAGPLVNLSGMARSISAAVDRSRNFDGNVSQMTSTVDAAQPSLPATTVSLKGSPAGVATHAEPVGDLTIRQSTALGKAEDAPTVPGADGSLLSEFRNSAAASSQQSTAAYQEYVKAWGGRVVHGEVEFPPLSIYLD